MLGYRLAGQHLSARVPADRLLEAAGACGLVAATPVTAASSLWARVAGLDADAVQRGVAARTLVQTWSLRGTLHVVPAADLQVFTHALLPPDEDGLRHAIRGAASLLDTMGLTAADLADHAEAAVAEVLDRRTVTGKSALDAALARAMRSGLPPELWARWDAASPFAEGQRAGEALASFSLRLLGLRMAVCVAGWKGAHAVFARTEDWLPGLVPGDAGAARTALVRKYLRCYGPSTVEDFGAWAGVHPRHAAFLWEAVAADLVPVEAGGMSGWLHRDDVGAFDAAPAPAGLRLLPPLDPWVQARDRRILLADRAQKRRVWKAAGWPGTVVHRGRIVALWRARAHGSRLRVEVEPLAAVESSFWPLLEEEAQGLARFRGHPSGAELSRPSS